jgi:hypothetical protein
MMVLMGEGCFFGMIPMGEGYTYGFGAVDGRQLKDPLAGRLERFRRWHRLKPAWSSLKPKSLNSIRSSTSKVT